MLLPGVAGTAGEAGTAGIAGTASTVGTAGTSGCAGTAGIAGTAGTSGAAGSPGIAGTAGCGCGGRGFVVFVIGRPEILKVVTMVLIGLSITTTVFEWRGVAQLRPVKKGEQ